MATALNDQVKAALHRVLSNPLLENARALEAALGAVFQKRVFGRINQKASIEAASESDRGVTERLANAFDVIFNCSAPCGWHCEKRSHFDPT